MRKYFFWLLGVTFIISCKVSNRLNVGDGSAIVYKVPYAIEELLVSELKQSNKEAYIEFWNNDGIFKIYLVVHDKDQTHPWIVQSNRKMLLGRKFYPIVFDSDRSFALNESPAQVLQILDTSRYPSFSRKFPGHSGAYFIKFRQNGEILEKGYSGLKSKMK